MKIQDIPSQLRPELCCNDFEDTYTLPGGEFSFIDTNLTDVRFLRLNPEAPDSGDVITDSRDIRYAVEFFASDKMTSVCRCKRVFFFCLELYSTGGNQRGKVVNRELLKIEKNFQRKGIATHLLPQEEEVLFSKWGAVEVHLMAMGDGPVVWTKRKFDYTIAPETLGYLTETYKAIFHHEDTPCPEIRSMRDFPEEFWDYVHKKQIRVDLYKTLVRDNERFRT